MTKGIPRTEFPLKIPRLLIAFGIVAFLVVMTIYMWNQREKNLKDMNLFYQADITGVIERVGRGSGGWHPIYLTDGRVFRFCPQESYIEREINKGDTISKPPKSDTVFIRNNDKLLKITFLK
jgi:hypothetical protein